MKTLKILLTATLLVSAAAVQADAISESPLSNLIYVESSVVYSTNGQQSSSPQGILSYGDDHNKNSVWSTEFEQYVNPGDFQQGEVANVEDVNSLMGDNPTAAGTSRETFIYNELAGEYHLQ